MTLDEIALALQPSTDKDSRKHGYTRIYDEVFTPMRDCDIRLLEIGVWEGASLRMWQKYFPSGRVYGIENDGMVLATLPWASTDTDIVIIRADQADAETMRTVAEQLRPLDIVIDDGSHVPLHQVISFNALWPHVAPGGWYCIEDLHMHWHHPRMIPNVLPGLLATLSGDICYNGKLQWADLDNASPSELTTINDAERQIAEIRMYPCLLMVKKREAI